MTTQSTTEIFHRNNARMLDTAEGVLVALRRYSPAEAFAEILDTAQRHRVPALGLARALVELAGAESADEPGGSAAIARSAWGHLFTGSAAEVPAPA